MYAIVLLRYRKPIEQVVANTEAHRAYLRSLMENGTLLVAGPLDPRYGGALLLRVPDHQDTKALDALIQADPFYVNGIAQYEILPWNPVMGAEALDRL